MEPGLLQVRLDADSAAKTKDTPARTATWLCIPYFSLQKYGGPLSGATSGSFPTRTLLQEQYSGVSAERDMQQAVCQTGHVPPGMCFHVAQMWCIVLDDCLFAFSRCQMDLELTPYQLYSSLVVQCLIPR